RQTATNRGCVAAASGICDAHVGRQRSTNAVRGKASMLRALMRRPLACLLFLASFAVAPAARADEDGDEIPRDLPRLILDSGRPEALAPDPEAYRLFVHGEHQIRFQA